MTTLAAAAGSAFLWFVGGQGMCGEEVYDTPPGSAGDTLCQSLVGPVAPWAAIAALPLMLAAIGGLIAIGLESRRLFFVALVAPLLLVVVGVLATLALF